MTGGQPLWAPWRMAYIKHGKPEHQEGHCFLCAAPGHDSLVIWEGDSTFAMLNRFPYNPGHLLIAPKAHRADFENFSADEALELNVGLQICLRALRETMNPQGFNVGMNLGSAAGAGVPEHLHLHIVPRWSGDNNFMPVIGETRVLPELLEDTAARLREAIEKEG
ncbi:MAG: HIT domain-containing protein [Candidatus Dadabacteria bacterium]|nr:MAG: HIT domain-containing protein [Candidatus Dadabacteria bacterium]